MRVSRAEEALFGSSRPAFQGRIKMGFRADGRITAVDLYIVQQNGPYSGGGDLGGAAGAVSLLYQPLGDALSRRPSQHQHHADGRAARPRPEPDRGGARAADRQSRQGARARSRRDSRASTPPATTPSTTRSKAPSRARINAKRSSAVRPRSTGKSASRAAVKRAARRSPASASARHFHAAGRGGLDGIVRITPDGKLHIHCGVGNLGTFSYAATSRVAAEVLKVRWDNCIIERGDSRLGLPFSSPQSGSNTSFTMTRATYAGAMDALAKLKEIAAATLGGAADDYDIADETVFAKADRSRSMTYAAAAQRAIELGGRFSGQEVPEDINAVTKSGVAAIAGTGLVGVAKDNIAVTGMVPAIAIGFIEIELDKETGKVDIVEYLGVADCGTVLHPMGLERADPQRRRHGLRHGPERAAHLRSAERPARQRRALTQAKPPSYLDVPSHMQTLAVDIRIRRIPSARKASASPSKAARRRRCSRRSPTRSAATTSIARPCCPT